MADDEEVVEVQKKKERPVRRLQMRECDVPSALATEMVELAQQAMDDETIQKNMAQYVKQKLDKEKGGTWHVITGAHFGGNVTNDAGTLVNFQLDNTWFLIFRSGPPEKTPEK